MTFLLDTNVVSEWVKPRPNAGLTEWLSHVNEDAVFLSVVTFAELRFGVERLAPGSRRTRLDEWLRIELPVRFEQRILLVDGAVADEWGRMVARGAQRGRPIGAMDALVASTAQVHGLTLVTRNAKDFEGAVKSVLNPWT
jgi:predicted nucleic acid-binding protein